MELERITVERQVHFHLSIDPKGSFSLAKNEWLLDFRNKAKTHIGEDVWTPKIAGRVGQYYRIIEPEKAQSTNKFGWLELPNIGEGSTFYRPDAVKQYDSLMASVAIAKVFKISKSDSELGDQIAGIASALRNGDEENSFFPGCELQEALGDAWCIEVIYQGELNYPNARKAAYTVLSSLFVDSRCEDMERLNLLGSTETKLPFGWFFKCHVRKRGKSTSDVRPCYITLVEDKSEAETNVSSSVGEHFLNEMILPDVKTIHLEEMYWRLRMKVERASRRVEMKIEESTNEKKRSGRELRLAASDAHSATVEWGAAASLFLRAATTINQNAKNSRQAATELAQSAGLSTSDQERFIEVVSSDVSIVRNQYFADKEWIAVEKENSVGLAHMVKEQYRDSAGEHDQIRKDVASLWLALIAIVLAVFGIPDWFPNPNEWQAIPLGWRATFVAIVFIGSGFLFLRSYRKLILE